MPQCLPTAPFVYIHYKLGNVVSKKWLTMVEVFNEWSNVVMLLFLHAFVLDMIPECTVISDRNSRNNLVPNYWSPSESCKALFTQETHFQVIIYGQLVAIPKFHIWKVIL